MTAVCPKWCQLCTVGRSTQPEGHQLRPVCPFTSFCQNPRKSPSKSKFSSSQDFGKVSQYGMIAPSGGNEGTADILKMLEQLGETIDLPRGFGPIIWGLNREEVLMQIAKIRASLPTELKQAAQRVRESERIVEGARDDASATMDQAKREADRIIAEARREAERLIEHAKIQQERMVADSEILKLAKAQSEELRNTADRDAVQIRRGAENYAMDVLQRLEGVIGKVMHSIERGKQDLDRNEAAVGRDRALLK